MEKIEILDAEIWIAADSAEAKKLWREHPADRSKLWTEDETWTHCLDSPEQIQEVIDKKKERPGIY